MTRSAATDGAEPPSNGDSGRRRPSNYDKDDQLDINLPGENYAPTQGPLGERQQQRRKREEEPSERR